jgi:DNA-binding FrmR family transcriptional regulator
VTTPGYSDTKQDVLLRLRRIEGQVRGLQRMVESGRPCPEILDQMSSVRRALDAAAKAVILSHTCECSLSRTEDRAALLELVSRHWR